MLVKIRNVTIGKKNELPFDLDHLVNIGRYEMNGQGEFRGKGFGKEAKDNALKYIAKFAEHKDSTVAVLDHERWTKKFYVAKVSFYENLTDSIVREKLESEYS